MFIFLSLHADPWLDVSLALNGFQDDRKCVRVYVKHILKGLVELKGKHWIDELQVIFNWSKKINNGIQMTWQAEKERKK